MMRAQFQLALAASLIIAAVGAQAAPITLTVAPSGAEFTRLGNAIASETAGNTYTIQIAAGTYPDDFSTVNQPTSIIAIGGTAILQANIPPPDLKGIITTNTSLSVNGLTFQGAAISQADGANAAGIRDQSTGQTTLHVENSSFIGNQNGILTASGLPVGSGNKETVEIINSFFLDNGSGDGSTHALYVGDALSLLVQNSTFCGTNEGHDIKSRALSTTVQGSKIFDGATGAGCGSAGTTSFGIELPFGGGVQILDDALVQGALTHNNGMLGYGAEGLPYANNSLFVGQGTSFVSSGVANSIGIRNFTAPSGTCQLGSSTTFTGVATPVSPSDFCVSVTEVPPVTGVDEPSAFWLLLTAGLAWVVTLWRARARGPTGLGWRASGTGQHAAAR
jgi:hypothetical protein